MKTLPIHRDEKKTRAMVDCATGEVSVYRMCAYCGRCHGVRMGPRVYPSPQDLALQAIRQGKAQDEALMEAAMQFNSLVRDGEAIECNDDAGEGYSPRYR
ncbi:MAG TPA: hypothetical protein VMS89_06325 [Methanoregulaceae archaeon]|nr:hypothetical protein [Methanoregulaceae archaeon]